MGWKVYSTILVGVFLLQLLNMHLCDFHKSQVHVSRHTSSTSRLGVDNDNDERNRERTRMGSEFAAFRDHLTFVGSSRVLILPRTVQNDDDLARHLSQVSTYYNKKYRAQDSGISHSGSGDVSQAVSSMAEGESRAVDARQSREQVSSSLGSSSDLEGPIENGDDGQDSEVSTGIGRTSGSITSVTSSSSSSSSGSNDDAAADTDPVGDVPDGSSQENGGGDTLAGLMAQAAITAVQPALDAPTHYNLVTWLDPFSIGRDGNGIPSKICYAAAHGYSLTLAVAPPKGKGAGLDLKAAVLADALNRIRMGDYLVWLDADTVVFNGAIKLEDVIADASSHADIILTYQLGQQYPNNGVIIFRKSPWTLQFMSHWVQEMRMHRGKFVLWGDNQTFVTVLLQLAQGKKNDYATQNHFGTGSGYLHPCSRKDIIGSNQLVKSCFQKTLTSVYGSKWYAALAANGRASLLDGKVMLVPDHSSNKLNINAWDAFGDGVPAQWKTLLFVHTKRTGRRDKQSIEVGGRMGPGSFCHAPRKQKKRKKKRT